ncbi:MAG: hypothetical protein H0U13_16645, partial [Gemmatimonadaceae bacterium]|nr:hypothetical protein [Gemmatimonadaceae bacterium]
MSESGPSSRHTEPARQSSSLSDISHLFLSSVRDRTDSGARPQRRPPGQHTPRPAASIDLTPEEFTNVFNHEDALRTDPGVDDLSVAGHSQPSHVQQNMKIPEPHERNVPVKRAPISAVLAGHFGARQIERIYHYARQLASVNKRIGVIEVDASEFRLSCFDGHAHSHVEHASGGTPQLEPEVFDRRRMSEALAEMGWDVERWLLVLPSPRLPEAKAVLRTVRDW